MPAAQSASLATRELARTPVRANLSVALAHVRQRRRAKLNLFVGFLACWVGGKAIKAQTVAAVGQ